MDGGLDVACSRDHTHYKSYCRGHLVSIAESWLYRSYNILHCNTVVYGYDTLLLAAGLVDMAWNYNDLNEEV